MRFLIILSIAITAMHAAAQQPEENCASRNPYEKYYNCSFKCDFKATDKVISSFLDTSNNKYNHIASRFYPDSTYSIELSIVQKIDANVILNHFQFHGRYEVDSHGEILLIGKSPFDTSIIRIKEKKKKNDGTCIFLRGYVFRLNDQFSATNKRKLHTYCDGEPSLCE